MGAVPVQPQPRTSSGALAAGAKLERYEILAKLAAGGMASVYVARVQGVAGFERLVAIKVLHSNLAHEDEFIRMFLDEARLAASIRHPNVVPTIDVSDSKEAGCGYFIVMEYIEGDHLGALLTSAQKAGEKLPVPITLRVLADALAGLGAAHDLCDDTGKSLQLVHRDVSPHNIMVGRDGVVRLTDFGVAKAEDRLTHTRDGQVKGKLAYMAPEQAASGETDARSDLFSAGVILWECLTGQRLFRGETTAGTLHKLLNERVPAPSSIDPQLAPLDALLAKALARAPADRFQSTEEFGRAIEDVAAQVGGMASLRSVARFVKTHAAAKLKREKKLIDDAMRALRPADAVVPDTVAGDDVTSPSTVSSNEISIASLPSASKVSGVFAHDTMPGAQRSSARRSGEVSAGVLVITSNHVHDSDAATLRPKNPIELPSPAAPLVVKPVDAQPVAATQRPRLRVAAWLAAFAVLASSAVYFFGFAGRSEPAASAQPAAAAVLTTTPAQPADPVPLPNPPAPRPAAPSESAPAAVAPQTPPARAVRAGTRRDDLPAARSYGRRTRRDVSPRAQRRAPQSDVMPNPYHD